MPSAIFLIVPFRASSADTALSLLMTLESEGHRACLMNHAPDQVAAAKDQSRILNSTVYLVLVTQKYEDSKQCRLDFAYAKSYDRGMLGVFLEPELGVRGDASTCLRRYCWRPD
ncbi:hypothetical protein BDR26DRAFT_869647 [Obelidium mucronatum]|nr:hypothetical protein BDR26DRAFT_869647 [Obelidium mucronatum]